ncbi:DUF693 family protein [Borrelia puertoricensis]|uniref:DUF693 family protein n=1 Tax=Borrelia puertoricensis TaxID=2756107 RepID=UPI001FF2527C|nr:DUF693 family protein [Borrelia puertoricensis]UPA18545.1 DUF693 family protein [Borrelia puertoricensis]
MILLKYDFKIEFYSTISSNKNITGDATPEHSPKIIINTQHGIYVDISISNIYSSYNFVRAKQAKLVLWNLHLDFNNHIHEGDIVKIYYKKFAHEDSFTFIMAGYLGVPMSSDYPSGDFSIELELHLASKSNFFNRELETKQFKGMTVQDAINFAFPGRNIINMSTNDRLKIIEEHIYARTPKEFIEKLSKKYIQNVIADVGNGVDLVECNFIFTNHQLTGPDAHYESLEDYGLEFIPKQEITIGTTLNIRLIYWRAKLTYTHKLKVGDRVSFRDSLGNIIKSTICETNASLSNTGECSLNLKLYDDINHLKIKERI